MTVVSAVAVSHAPGIVAWPDRPEPDVAERLYAGFREAAARLRDSRLDAVLLVTAEHFANFFDVIPPYYINLADSARGPVEPWLGIPEREVPGNGALASALLEGCLADGVDLSYGHSLALDHGSFVPIEMLGLDHVPVVPMIVNALVEPMPTHHRCRDVGRAIGRVLADRPERVAVVAAGGLSHWPGMAEAGLMSPTWDKAVLAGLERGEREVLWDPPSEGSEDAGPGAAELRSWAVAGAAAPAGKSEVLAYEAVAEWATGCAVVELYAEPR